MAKVQFFKGTYAKIKAISSRVEDGIYVATDRPYIFVGSQEIGIDGSVVSTFEWVDASNALKISYKDGSEKVVTVPVAGADKNGLMSKEDYAKLAAIDSSWFGVGHVQSDRVVWATDIADMATKSDVSTAVADKLNEAQVIAILDASLAPYAKTEDISTGYVHAESGKRLMTDAEGTKLEGIAAGAEVNLVDGVADGDHILSLSDKKISATLAINYDSSAKKIQLTGKDGSVFSEFSAEEFVKDGILYGTAMVKASAEGTVHVVVKDTSTDLTGLTPNHMHLVLCFSTYDLREEKLKFDWHAIDVESLIDVYKAGAGISIDASNNISVNIAEDTSVNKNFLDMEGDASLAVRSVDADCVPTVEDVEVLGGPLAGQVTNWPSAWYKDGKKIVPANLTMQEFITGLYFKELLGTVSKESYNWNPSVAKPNASLSSTSTQEVGAQLTATYSVNSTVSDNTRTVTVSQDAQNFGMFVGDTYQSENKTFSKNGEVGGDTTIESATWNGNTIESGVSVTAAEGTNTLYVAQRGTIVTVDCFSGEPKCYGATNQHKKNAASSVDVNETDPFMSKTLTNNNTVKVTAYYPIYSNGANSSTTDTTTPVVTRAEGDTHKHPLTADNTEFGVAFAAMTAGGEGYRLVIEEHKTITSAKALNGLTSKYDIDVKSKFVKSSTTVTKATGNTTANYYVWEYTGTEGANRVNFKID